MKIRKDSFWRNGGNKHRNFGFSTYCQKKREMEVRHLQRCSYECPEYSHAYAHFETLVKDKRKLTFTSRWKYFWWFMFYMIHNYESPRNRSSKLFLLHSSGRYRMWWSVLIFQLLNFIFLYQAWKTDEELRTIQGNKRTERAMMIRAEHPENISLDSIEHIPLGANEMIFA